MSSAWWKGPAKQAPDFKNLQTVLEGGRPSRPTLFEFFLNRDLFKILAPEYALKAAPTAFDEDLLRIMAYRNAGYDYAFTHVPGMVFETGTHGQLATISQNETVMITDRASFDAYRWPDPEKADYAYIDKLSEVTPKGMKLGIVGPGGVLENTTFLLGFENMCYLLADGSGLAEDVFSAVGSRLVKMYSRAIQHPAVGFLIGNDDWGFKSQLMLSPDDMRRLVFPWHRQIVEAAHAAGKPAMIHSCGNLTSVMDELIDELGYDGKHSYEDTIQPVEEAYDQYGSRIAILGGIDVDFLCRSTPEAVYERSAAMVAKASTRGGYALGSGNSIPKYVPPDNYFAMIKAALDRRG